MKTGITIKGGNVTRLGLLNRVLDLTDKITSKDYRNDGYEERMLTSEEVISFNNVYKSVAEAISTIDTNSQGIVVTNCNFTGMDLGMKIEQSPEENIKESTQEGIIEEGQYEDCKEDDICNECECREHKESLIDLDNDEDKDEKSEE